MSLQRILNVCILYIYKYKYIYREREKGVILRNWLTQLWWLDKNKICRVGWQAGDQGKICSSSSKAVGWQSSLLLNRRFYSVSLSIHKNSLLVSHVYKNQSSPHRLFTTLFAVKSFLAETGHNLWL